MITKLWNWLIWLPNPKGRRDYEARLARLAQRDFWVSESNRIHALFLAADTLDEKIRLDRQFWVAVGRFDKEAAL